MRGSGLGSAEICQMLRVDLFLLTTLSKLGACVRARARASPADRGRGLIMKRWCVRVRRVKGRPWRLLCSNPSWPPAQQASRHPAGRGRGRGQASAAIVWKWRRQEQRNETCASFAVLLSRFSLSNHPRNCRGVSHTGLRRICAAALR